MLSTKIEKFKICDRCASISEKNAYKIIYITGSMCQNMHSSAWEQGVLKTGTGMDTEFLGYSGKCNEK